MFDAQGSPKLVDLSLEHWDDHAFQGFVEDLGIDYVSFPSEISEIQILQSGLAEDVAILANDAEALYQDSLHEYWRTESYFVGPAKDREGVPIGFYKARGGAFSTKFSSALYGWRMHVCFDSSDYPALEDTLQAAHTLKVRFARDVAIILTGLQAESRAK
ncbi:MAG: hypothetical protein GY930_06205 [bacterium]|nr:hypothetical protein [bacterium]